MGSSGGGGGMGSVSGAGQGSGGVGGAVRGRWNPREREAAIAALPAKVGGYELIFPFNDSTAKLASKASATSSHTPSPTYRLLLSPAWSPFSLPLDPLLGWPSSSLPHLRCRRYRDRRRHSSPPTGAVGYLRIHRFCLSWQVGGSEALVVGEIRSELQAATALATERGDVSLSTATASAAAVSAQAKATLPPVPPAGRSEDGRSGATDATNRQGGRRSQSESMRRHKDAAAVSCVQQCSSSK